jgi:hypothetical protein
MVSLLNQENALVVVFAKAERSVAARGTTADDYNILLNGRTTGSGNGDRSQGGNRQVIERGSNRHDKRINV